jgi:hypothetical protein
MENTKESGLTETEREEYERVIKIIMSVFALSRERAEVIYANNKGNGLFDEPWFRIIMDGDYYL